MRRHHVRGGNLHLDQRVNGTSTQTFTRNNVFSFSDRPPYTVNSWDPNVNGEVNTIAFNGGNCTDAYIGGKFTMVGSTAVKNIAEINTTTGAVVSTFKSNSSGQVETLSWRPRATC